MPQVLPHLPASLQRFTLRQRILLLFSGLAGAALLALALGLYLGYKRHPNPWALEALVVAGVLAGCAIAGFIALLWRLFDEHVGKPLERLAGELRARAHASVDTDMEDVPAHHLGDLAPAAAALMRHLNEARNELAETIARETTRQAREKERLITLLGDLPVGVLICTPDHRLVFYNGAAQAILGLSNHGVRQQFAQAQGDMLSLLCLGRSVFDYVGEAELQQACAVLQAQAGRDIALPLSCVSVETGQRFQAVLRQLSEPLSTPGAAGSGYLLVLHGAMAGPSATPAPRRAVYDFDLLHSRLHAGLEDTALNALSFVVFDTETTGLFPSRGDEIVQLAAVRIVSGKRVQAEILNTLVNPGRPIPPASSRIHGITDDMVTAAPGITEVAALFHKFAKNSVLVAHNAGFDMAFLQRDQARIGLRFDHPLLDTVLLSAVVFGDAENHSLDALTARLGVSFTADARHTALGDATATAEVLLKLLPALQARGLRTLGELNTECRRHARLLRGYKGR